ncbi:unnamed protein product [Rangifer tarandus platyrhynchus]|uniref:Uncharacterized protein n=1 Tax=Rangifer tarandus platyrhynchus TaxID=3082113 RepID=A0ACB1KDY6_RANTA
MAHSFIELCKPLCHNKAMMHESGQIMSHASKVMLKILHARLQHYANQELPDVHKKESESKVKVKSLSHVQLFVTPWTVAYHTPPSMGFSRQEYWSGFPFPSPEDLPDPGIKPGSPAL